MPMFSEAGRISAKPSAAGIGTIQKRLTSWPCSLVFLKASSSSKKTPMKTAMTETRKAADALETVVSSNLWPLPTYAEMLFLY